MHFDRHTLATRRTVAGLSPAELAALAGISREAIRLIELGHSTPRPRTAKALASALDIDVSDLWTVGERAA
jgi:DNA-binding XRE family transcriptional regulator